MTATHFQHEIQSLIQAYDRLVGGINHKAEVSDDRAYGGIIRAGKGKLVEKLAENIVTMAWGELGGDMGRFSTENRTHKIPLQPGYVEKIRNEQVRNHLRSQPEKYFYGAKPDIHVSVDGKFVMGIECKAYTENAMFKRILVDFTLLKEVNPRLDCVLFQLESQLGGDYGEVQKEAIFGSPSTHVLMSHFDIDLTIITLLQGERKVERPIHKPEYFKKLEPESIRRAVRLFSESLKKHL